MFRKYSISLNRVHDSIVIKEGAETLSLTVNGDPMRMVSGLNNSQLRMKGITDETPVEDVKDCALYFATVIFGKEQAEKLVDFYANDPACVISVCGKYFKERLADKIAKVQKKTK